jgi:hypothetical protein
MNTENKNLVHPFEFAKLGVAPFAFVVLLTAPSTSLAEANATAYENAQRDFWQSLRGFGISSGGSCEYCGTPIKNHCVIRDSAGKHFVVGCDCVRKTEDGKLIDTVEKARRAILTEARDNARRAMYTDRIEAEKEANDLAGFGLKTDVEVESDFRESQNEIRRAAIVEANKWLTEVLSGIRTAGEFIPSMLRDLDGRVFAADLFPNALRILSEIYAKECAGTGRKTNPSYQKYLSDFDANMEESGRTSEAFIARQAAEAVSFKADRAAAIAARTLTAAPRKPAPFVKATLPAPVAIPEEEAANIERVIVRHLPAAGAVYPLEYLTAAGDWTKDRTAARRFPSIEALDREKPTMTLPGRSEATEFFTAARRNWCSARRFVELDTVEAEAKEIWGK